MFILCVNVCNKHMGKHHAWNEGNIRCLERFRNILRAWGTLNSLCMWSKERNIKCIARKNIPMCGVPTEEHAKNIIQIYTRPSINFLSLVLLLFFICCLFILPMECLTANRKNVFKRGNTSTSVDLCLRTKIYSCFR